LLSGSSTIVPTKGVVVQIVLLSVQLVWIVSPYTVDIKSKTEVEFDPSVTTVYGDTIQTNCTESNTICTTTPLVGTIVEEPDNNDQMNSSEETI
jgi:hypothetical protein